MVIIPTRVCNKNKCTYCSVYKKDFEKLFFDNFDILDFYQKVILLSEKSGDYEIRFFGGEPFIRFDVIEKIVKYFKLNNNNFQFAINTNLSIINKKQIDFIKTNDIKLIISCNGNIQTHSKTRGISIGETLNLYKNIKLVLKNNIRHQINMVVTRENAKMLRDNIVFMEKKLGVKNINLLPVNYNKNGWNDKGLLDLEESFNNLAKDINSRIINVHFINKDINNDVPLFSSEFVLDSDGNIYPNMVVLETFFLKEKEKIKISNLDKNITDLLKDLNFYEIENNKLYSFYINKVLKSKFSNIMEKDNKAGILFHNFLQKI